MDQPQPNAARDRQIEEIVKECLQLWNEGKAVDEVEIVDAHPELGPELAEQLRKLRMVGKAVQAANQLPPTTGGPNPVDGLRVRCPHCRNAMEVVEDSVAIQCESCGGSVSFSDEQDDAVSPRYLGHFRFVSQLGIGAFGSVWRAYDEELDRDVAIKIPRRSQLDDFQSEQFFREARIAAQLDHPNIVSVHEIGREAGIVYIVSDLVEGVPLSQWMRARTLNVRDIAQLMETLANTLQHAHDLGVVHRDLKPANVMMDQQDQPRIMDFGLAKRDVGEITMTADGQVLGTPAYMSPEQALGDAHRVDGRSDIYSLGVMLFELITGELPFRGTTGMLMDQVIHDEPPSPRRLAHHIPRDLETICLKCLSKAPVSRYATAKQLASELARFGRGEPIIARPVSKIDRAWRWCKRHPMAAIAMSLVAFLAVAGPLYAIHEHDLRTKLQIRYEERISMRKRDVQRTGKVGTTIGEFTAQFPAEDDQSAAGQWLAQTAAAKYKTTPGVSTIERLIGTGIIFAANNDVPKATEALEAANALLSEQMQADQATLLVLSKADCCARLSRLYRDTDPKQAISWAEQAVQLADQVILGDPSFVAHAIRDRARSCLVHAFNAAGQPVRALQIARTLPTSTDEMQQWLPNSDREIYSFAFQYFGEMPPLLPINSQTVDR